MSQGVVQAAREVAQVQNRFQNLGGSFAKGVQVAEANKAARRKEKQKQVSEVLKRSRKLAGELDSNINYLGYSNEETKILKTASIEKADRYNELSSQLAQYESAAMPGYQDLVDERNAIQNWFNNVEKQQELRLAQRSNYDADLDGKRISKAGQNLSFTENAETINHGSFTGIDEQGMFQWGELTLKDGDKYFNNPGEALEYIQKEYSKVLEKKSLYSPEQLDMKASAFEEMIEDKNVLAGLMIEDGPFTNSFTDEMKERFDNAYEADDDEAIAAIAKEVANGYRTFLQEKNTNQVNFVKAQEDPGSQDAPTGPFANLSADSRATVKMFENGANFFSVGGGDRAYAYDEAGNISVLANGRPNPKYNGKPSVYVIGTYDDGQFTPNEARSGKIEAGNTAEFVRIVGLK